MTVLAQLDSTPPPHTANLPVKAGVLVLALLLFVGVLAGATYGVHLSRATETQFVTVYEPVLATTPGSSVDVAFSFENVGAERAAYVVSLRAPDGFPTPSPLRFEAGPGQRIGQFIPLDVPAGAAVGAHKLFLVVSDDEGNRLGATALTLKLQPRGVAPDFVRPDSLLNLSIVLRTTAGEILLTTDEVYAQPPFRTHATYQRPTQYGTVDVPWPQDAPYDQAFNVLADASVGQTHAITTPPNAVWQKTTLVDSVYDRDVEFPTEGALRREVFNTTENNLRRFVGENTTIEDGAVVTIPRAQGQDGRYLVEMGEEGNLTLREYAEVGQPVPRAPAVRPAAAWQAEVVALTADEIRYRWIVPEEGTRFTFMGGDTHLQRLRDKAVVQGVENGDILIRFDVTEGERIRDAERVFTVSDVDAGSFRLLGENVHPFSDLEIRWVFKVHGIR